METILIFFSLKYRGNWDRIYSALEQKEAVLRSELRTAKEIIKSDYLTIIDSNFPEALKRCPNPPFVLFSTGNQELLTHYDQTVAVVGGESYETSALTLTQQFVKDWIKKGCVIVIGDDMAIFDSLIEFIGINQGKVIVITHQDLLTFQARHRQRLKIFKDESLLVVSEFYQECDQTFDNQGLYQRLLVALTRRLLFLQIKQQEANFEIFNLATREEKEVFAIPEAVNSVFDGSNLIIKRRGKLVETADDVITIPIYH